MKREGINWINLYIWIMERQHFQNLKEFMKFIKRWAIFIGISE